MNRSRRQVQTTTLTTAPARPVTVVRTTTSSTPRTRPRRRTRQLNQQLSTPRMRAGDDCVRAYLDTLSNPFDYPPVRLGFGCLVPSDLTTAYFRNPIAAAADGTIAFLLFPSLGYTNAPIWYNNGGLTSTTWTGMNFTNAAALHALMNEARVVSHGIRLIPQIPATSAPGYAYAGTLPTAAAAGIATRNPQALITLPSLAMGMATGGCSVTGRPIDPDSFTFHHFTVAGYGVNDLSTSSCPLIVLTNLPPGASVLCSAVMNLESIRSLENDAAVMTGTQQRPAPGPTLSDRFASIEQMWSTVSSSLPSVETLNVGASILNRVAGTAYAVNRALGGDRARLFGHIYPPMRIEEVQ